MKINHIDHIVLMVKNVDKTANFYSKFLGKPLHQDKDSVSYQIGKSKLFLGLPYKDLKNNKFNKDRLGLNHLAFGLKSMAELKNMQKSLARHKIENSGIQIDKYSKNPFVWFDDPDGIRLEFYLRKFLK